MSRYETDLSGVLVQLCADVLKDLAHRYSESLRARRLAPSTVAVYLRATTHFARWLVLAKGRTAPPFRETDVTHFLANHISTCRCRPPAPRTMFTCRAALRHFVSVLDDGELFLADRREPSSPVQHEVQLFDNHLLTVCGASEQTRLHRTRYVTEFLTHVFGRGAVRYDELSPEHLGGFLLARAKCCRPGTAGVITGGLRSYLRFLQFRGLGRDGLVDAVPRVARWRLASLPAHLREKDLSRFLHSFERRSARGRRDYAMALCLSVFGLRAGEVAALHLDDIDWHTGTATVRPGKTSHGRTLPLTPQVGEAIASYLRFRPQSTSAAVFLHIGARSGDPIAPSTVRSAMRLAYRRAGLPDACTGTHLLRHTAATRLVASGASIKEVADVLGHASIDSTGIYAKVDLPRLRGVAMSWPGVAR